MYQCARNWRNDDVASGLELLRRLYTRSMNPWHAQVHRPRQRTFHPKRAGVLFFSLIERREEEQEKRRSRRTRRDREGELLRATVLLLLLALNGIINQGAAYNMKANIYGRGILRWGRREMFCLKADG